MVTPLASAGMVMMTIPFESTGGVPHNGASANLQTPDGGGLIMTVAHI
ncbi:hypothetical protein NBRC3188_2424 [Acetobacter pasteurianus NBRC 3188]|uniref:Uncharacterized protein n=1 Tax=Acetobacter pasteurianus NBRC 3188 TaxID=1226663 RepID=A0A401WWJ1_ACEPA|nr:hypothetical protein NBRC3188_2424 [Acetobacter pasteurianus NBRC 3188]